MQRNQDTSVSVVICAYTEQRWQDLLDAVASLRHQTVAPREIIVVIDDNSSLFDRCSVHFHDVDGDHSIILLENCEQPGLSGARNTGIAAATGDIVAFLDDDAMATHNWVEQLLIGFADPNVMGVGGAIVPLWEQGRPGWFPEEFNWVVGCTYRGMPTEDAPIRNLIGANMSFRSEVFRTLGGFRNGVGQVGNSMLRCDDTEFCIRVGQCWPHRQMRYMPGTLVYHHVPTSRAQWRYFRLRCYTEGLAKALVTNIVGRQDGLSSEWSYTLQTLPSGVWHGICTTLKSGKFSGLGQACAITAGLLLTTLGYFVGTVATWQQGTSTLGWSSIFSTEKSAS